MTQPKLTVDIVSDVVCPWCIVGFRQLQAAMQALGVKADVTWHPFELNPTMGPDGQNLREHIMEKYGSTAEQSAAARSRLAEVGESLGIKFHFGDDSRIVNTFRAHQLIDWAETTGRQTDMKLAMFTAYFTGGRDVSNPDTLIDIAAEAGFDVEQAREIVTNNTRAAQVREKQKFWTDRGIQGVPAMIFAGKYLVTGAQGVENYTNILNQLVAEAA